MTEEKLDALLKSIETLQKEHSKGQSEKKARAPRKRSSGRRY